ncbi:arylsulfatase I-like, partial [Stegodyphus dumicola]|uniref:arylsulfatase I-like n=1 Tax=Stegodyphus dumicola TaxID=202533 RepID=UPI0015AE0C50
NEADIDVGFDLRNNTKLAREYNGVYSTTLFASVAKDLLSSHSPDEPLYLFLSFQSVHSPLQVPKAFEDRYSNIKDEKRRKYSGMVTAMDNAVGVVVEALKENGFWENCLIVFTTDNGGQTSAGGNNWPLRGGKGTLWEGGTRAVTFVYGSILKKRGYVNDKLFHAVDWFPTLLTVAGAQPVSGIDGIDQWTVLSENDTAVRNEIIYNIYDLDIPKAAIRIGDYKLIQGFPGKPTDWIAPADNSDAKSIYCTIKENSTEGLGQIYRLYNLKDDPTEHYNLAQKHPKVVHRLKRRLDKLKTRAVPADDPSSDEKGEPKFWRGSFSYGWCKAK